jgi:hypothetical protein
MTPALLSKLTPAQSRVVAVALAVVVLLVALTLLAGPIVWAHWHYDRVIEDSADRLERLRRVAAQAPEYRKALDAMRAMDGRRFFLQNSAPNLAGAELQELVKAAIEGNGGRINTSQNPQPRDDGPTKQIIVSVQFFATSPALAAILYAIETQSPELNVDNMTVRPLNAFRTFKPSPGQEPEVNVQMDVVGWALPEPVKPSAVPVSSGTRPGSPAGGNKPRAASPAAAKS